jgi:hypothetical protein
MGRADTATAVSPFVATAFEAPPAGGGAPGEPSPTRNQVEGDEVAEMPEGFCGVTVTVQLTVGSYRAAHEGNYVHCHRDPETLD